MLTQLQNPHLICFVTYSGPCGTTQPHIDWLLFCGQEDTLAAEGPGEEEGPGGVWPAGCICCMLATTARAPGLLGALLEVELWNERWLSVSAGRQSPVLPAQEGGSLGKESTFLFVAARALHLQAGEFA